MSFEVIAIAVVGAIAALAIGIALGRAGRSVLNQRLAQSASRIEHMESEVKERSRALVSMRSQMGNVANLALTLPHVVKDLNRQDLDPSEVPALLLRLANAIFQPKQLLLYGVHGAAGSEPTLRLLAHRGFGEVPRELGEIRIGEGKIGWVASHELDMLPDDWAKLVRTERVQVPDNHPNLKADIIGPLLTHAKQGQQLLGVLCLGDPQIHPGDEKLMFQLVTNIGSLGFVGSSNMKKLRSMANHDGLTGLMNKRHFTQDRAANLLIACESEAKPFSIFIFDIDHFKNYNDTNGHPAGDELLRRMARLIEQCLRPQDVCCRYGGEEFVMAMPNTGREQAFELADAIRQRIVSTRFEFAERQPLGHVSISGGVAAFPKDGASVAELIQHADQALYQSKKAGRNRVTPYRGVEIGSCDEGLDAAPDPALQPTSPGELDPRLEHR